MAASNLPDDNNKPPCYVWLGLESIHRYPDENRVLLNFAANPDHLNPSGAIMGGAISAMMDSALGEAVVNALASDESPVTLELKTSYLARATPGKIFAEGRLLRRGKKIAFSEATLRDETGEIVAAGSGTFSILQIKDQA